MKNDLAKVLGDYYEAGAEEPAEMKLLKALSDVGEGFGVAQLGGTLLGALGKKAVSLGEAGAIMPEELKKINSTDFYHGSGTKGLTKELLDTNTTNHESLFGQGLYLTDNPEIAQSYSKARSASAGERSLYKARLNAEKGINLEDPLEPDFQNVILKHADDISKRWGDDASIQALKSRINSGEIKTNQDLFKAFKGMVKDISYEQEIPTSEFVEDFQNMTDSFRNLGYDSFTHTGGMRVGGGKTPHKVMIMLDPKKLSSFEQIQ